MVSRWVDAPEPYAAFRMLDDTDLTGPAVYVWRRASGESYVGRAGVIQNRLADHRRAGMLTVIVSGDVYRVDSIEAAERLETALIWLLAPSENVQRPAPCGPLWAATINMARPVDRWSWWPSCGHVKIEGRTLADPLDVMRADCGCSPWLGWFDAARTAVEGLSAQIGALTERMESIPTSSVDALAAEVDVLTELLAERDARIDELEAEADELASQINHFERLRERADWTP